MRIVHVHVGPIPVWAELWKHSLFVNVHVCVHYAQCAYTLHKDSWMLSGTFHLFFLMTVFRQVPSQPAWWQIWPTAAIETNAFIYMEWDCCLCIVNLCTCTVLYMYVLEGEQNSEILFVCFNQIHFQSNLVLFIDVHKQMLCCCAPVMTVCIWVFPPS